MRSSCNPQAAKSRVLLERVRVPPPVSKLMKIVYVPEEVRSEGPSIFLAGPTPRHHEVKSWRPEALRELESFEGTVYVPESRSGRSRHSYDDQVQWETDALVAATCIMFWVPRELAPDPNGYPRMGALTTNMEFGMWMRSGKVVLGYPPRAEKMNYLAWHARRENITISHNLKDTVRLATALAREKHESLSTG